MNTEQIYAKLVKLHGLYFTEKFADLRKQGVDYDTEVYSLWNLHIDKKIRTNGGK